MKLPDNQHNTKTQTKTPDNICRCRTTSTELEL